MNLRVWLVLSMAFGAGVGAGVVAADPCWLLHFQRSAFGLSDHQIVRELDATPVPIAQPAALSLLWIGNGPCGQKKARQHRVDGPKKLGESIKGLSDCFRLYHQTFGGVKCL